MAMRMTGIMSGLDTETIIQELVAARRTKVDTAKKAQTKLQWKQDKWKELNTKLLNLYTKTVGNMRFSDAYSKKVTKSSNENAVSVLTGENAVNGVQSLRVVSLAKTAYLTGGQIEKDVNGNAVTASTTMSELGITEDSSFAVTIGGVDKTITVGADSKLSDVVKQFQDAGLNASFDEKNHRFFISAKESGLSHDFDIKSSDAAGEALLGALGMGTIQEYDGTTTPSNVATKISGKDAQITLNGATFTSDTNVFEINGLTITCTAETAEEVTLTTQDDTDGIYDMVKNFLTEYNKIINELDKLYNADPAKGYEPLTEDEKAEMSESEVEKWETKIKDSILRRDESVSSVASALKETMLAGVTVNGKQMFLSDFGIETLGYFSSADNEKNAYHINGDEDDSSTSGKTNTLKAMISSDPSTVEDFFLGLSQNLYKKLGELSKSVEGYSSFNSFYADKKMKEEYKDYTTKIADLEKKLTDYEDTWYAKFAAMETAMAKMQGNASAITGLLGG